MNAGRWLLAAGLGTVLVGFFALDLGHLFSLQTLQQHQHTLALLYAQDPWGTRAAYFALYLGVASLSVPGAALLTLAGGAVFGFGWALVLVSFASSMGATVSFWIARWLLRDWMQARFSTQLQEINAGVARAGALYLVSLRLIPVVPFFLVNLSMGLTRLKSWTFYWATQLGMLLGTAVYVNAGMQLASLRSLSDAVSPVVLGSLALVGLLPLIVRRVLRHGQRLRVLARWRTVQPRTFDCNLVVMGAGPCGLAAATVAAALRAKVTLVEANPHASEAVQSGMAQCAALGVEVVHGTARLTNPWAVEIVQGDGSTRHLTTRSVVIATGASAVVPPLPGLEAADFLTSDTLRQSLRTPNALPPRWVVLGGGPTGCELAQALRRGGAEVVLLERSARLLPEEDADVSACIHSALLADGVQVLPLHQPLRCLHAEGGKVLVVTHHGQETHLPFDRLLLAEGRAPRQDGCGLEALGIAADQAIPTDDTLQTVYPTIYAAGDVTGPLQRSDMAAHHGWYAAVNALFGDFKRFRVNDSAVVHTIPCTPAVARVGLNVQEAKAKGIAYVETVHPKHSPVPALVPGAAPDLVKVLSEPGKDRLLGATIVGANAQALLADYVHAMQHGWGPQRMARNLQKPSDTPQPPVQAANAWPRKPLAPTLLRWTERFLAWRRG